MHTLRQRAVWLPLVATLTLSALLTVVLFHYREALSHLGDWGYLGAFLTQLLNSLTVLFPATGHVVTLVLAAELNPWLLGLVGGVGAGLGELSGYLVGMSGRHVAEHDTPWLSRMRAWTRERGGIAIFTFAVLPVPFDIAGIWAGSTQYPAGRFLAYTSAGKVVKVTAIAWAGRYGIAWLEYIL